MRLISPFLILPALSLALAQDQHPLIATAQGWFEKAKSFIDSSIPSPLDAGAAAIASRQITNLTLQNWRSVLAPKPDSTGPENWMVLVTGGNKTCARSDCVELEAKYNKTAAVLAADPNAPNLARLDCEVQGILCTIWFTGPPCVWYIQVPVPAADQSKPATPIYVTPVNTTTVTVQDLVDIHANKDYEKRKELDGYMHPYDGQLSKFGLNVPVGYFLYFMQMVPSWAVMLLVSFITRTMM